MHILYISFNFVSNEWNGHFISQIQLSWKMCGIWCGGVLNLIKKVSVKPFSIISINTVIIFRSVWKIIINFFGEQETKLNFPSKTWRNFWNFGRNRKKIHFNPYSPCKFLISSFFVFTIHSSDQLTSPNAGLLEKYSFFPRSWKFENLAVTIFGLVQKIFQFLIWLI